MISNAKIVNAFIEVSHIEFQSYDVKRKQILCTSGLAEKVLGYTHEQYNELSKNFYEELVHPDDVAKMHESIEKLLASAQGEIVESTARYKRSNGDYLWIYTRKMVYQRDANDNPSVIITVAENVTEMIQILHKFHEATDKLKFVSWKNSHELRAPVANIIGLLDLIEEEHITSEHNLKVFIYLKETIKKLDKVIHEINNATHR